MSGDEADMTTLSLRPKEVARPNRNAANTRDEFVIHHDALATRLGCRSDPA
jgi:hypothetical protein